ncbi:hypothetical protein EFR00_18300 [Rhizobium sophoriradicis]|nr:hypothetical protein EFR00_18300 [Rhizobium sophoriradicis]
MGHPLCPTGHLPHKGEIGRGWNIAPSPPYRPRRAVVIWAKSSPPPDLPPCGEMPGRAEGVAPP